MSHALTVDLSDAAFTALRAAADAAGVSPAELASASVEDRFAGPGRDRPPAGRGDIRKFFGTMSGAAAPGLDNDRIDADLADEYAGRHEAG